jgi:formylmethanofuran dehydrogenase subunit D
MSYPQFNGFRLVAGQDLCDLPDGTEVYVEHKDGHLVKATKVTNAANSGWSSKITVSEAGRYKRRKPTSWHAEEAFYISEGSGSWFCQAWVREEAAVDFTAGQVIEVKSKQGVWCKFTVVDEPDSAGDLWVSNYLGQYYGANEFVFWHSAVAKFNGRSGTIKIAKNEIRLAQTTTVEPTPEEQDKVSVNWADLQVGQRIEVKDIRGNWVACTIRDSDFDEDESIYIQAEDDIEIEDSDGDKLYVDAGDRVWIWFDRHQIRLPEVAESEQVVVSLATVQAGDKVEILSQEGNWVVAEVRKNDWSRDQSLFVIVSEEGTFKNGMGDRRSIDKDFGFWAFAETNSMRLCSVANPVEAAAETPEQEIARLQARLLELRRIKQLEDSRETVSLEWCGVDNSDTPLTGEFWILVELDGHYLDRDLDLSPGYVNTRNIFRRIDN